jgi:hypothetical protein
MPPSFSSLKKKFFFHGTPKTNVKGIMSNGFEVERGRATFSISPLYASSFSSLVTRDAVKSRDLGAIVNDGVALVFSGDKKFRVAKESTISINPKTKLVKGWPNRFKSEQHGHFSSSRKMRGVLSKRKIVAILKYTPDLLRTLNELTLKVKSGKLSSFDITTFIDSIQKQVSSKEVHHIVPKVSPSELALSITLGTIRFQVKREIREAWLSTLRNQGYTISNNGKHPVKLRTPQEVNQTVNSLRKIINKDFVDLDLRKEFAKYFGGQATK